MVPKDISDLMLSSFLKVISPLPTIRVKNKAHDLTYYV